MDINQCDDAAAEEDNSDVVNDAFLGTHKCHPDTSTCQFVSGGGWTKGKGYVCQCKPGHFIPIKQTEKAGYFNGSMVEGTWILLATLQNSSFASCSQKNCVKIGKRRLGTGKPFEKPFCESKLISREPEKFSNVNFPNFPTYYLFTFLNF